jgi:hypothetical protein
MYNSKALSLLRKKNFSHHNNLSTRVHQLGHADAEVFAELFDDTTKTSDLATSVRKRLRIAKSGARRLYICFYQDRIHPVIVLNIFGVMIKFLYFH